MWPMVLIVEADQRDRSFHGQKLYLRGWDAMQSKFHHLRTQRRRVQQCDDVLMDSTILQSQIQAKACKIADHCSHSPRSPCTGVICTDAQKKCRGQGSGKQTAIPTLFRSGTGPRQGLRNNLDLSAGDH